MSGDESGKGLGVRGAPATHPHTVTPTVNAEPVSCIAGSIATWAVVGRPVGSGVPGVLGVTGPREMCLVRSPLGEAA